jgi:hypothetical protein
VGAVAFGRRFWIFRAPWLRGSSYRPLRSHTTNKASSDHLPKVNLRRYRARVDGAKLDAHGWPPGIEHPHLAEVLSFSRFTISRNPSMANKANCCYHIDNACKKLRFLDESKVPVLVQ